jgi:hypothetical protein
MADTATTTAGTTDATATTAGTTAATAADKAVADSQATTQATTEAAKAGDTAATATTDTKAGDTSAGTTEEVKYDLTLPDGETDATLLERTTAIARESGLTPTQAQRIAAFASQEAATRATATREALIQSYQPGGAEWTKQADAWKTQTLADPKLGKTPEERKAAVTKGLAVIERYKDAHADDAKAMQGFFDTSGLGDHPTVARFFAWLGEAAAEGSLVTGGATGGAGRSTAELMYGPDGGKSKSQVIVTEG